MCLRRVFEHVADRLTVGDTRNAVLSLDYPCDIRMGEKTLFIRDRQAHKDILATYRQNLVQEGYERTEVEVLQETDAGQRGVNALVVWRHYARNGSLIRELLASYFAKRQANGIWHMLLIEHVDTPNDRHISGLPVYEHVVRN